MVTTCRITKGCVRNVISFLSIFFPFVPKKKHTKKMKNNNSHTCDNDWCVQHRWSRGRSKERGRRSPHNGDAGVHGDESTDYAADNSSEHSSSATQSPRHRATTIGGSPLARTDFLRKKNDLQKDFMLSTDGMASSQPTLDTLHVSIRQFLSSIGKFWHWIAMISDKFRKFLWTID